MTLRSVDRCRGATLVLLGLALFAPHAVAADKASASTPTNTLPAGFPPDTLAPPASPEEDKTPIIPPQAFWFPVGEELIYDVYWGVIPVGEARVWSEWVRRDGRVLLALRFRTRSNKVIATIYPVNDELETLVDPATFLPLRFEKNMHEGRHRYHEVTLFDHTNLTAYWRSLIKNKSEQFSIEPDTRDIATFMYFLRKRPVHSGEHHYRVMADEKIYDLYLKVAAEEKVKLDNFGRISCSRIEPDAKFDGLFVRKGKMTLWVSRDARCISTRITASVPVADVKIVLRAVRGPGNDEWIRRSPKDD